MKIMIWRNGWVSPVRKAFQVRTTDRKPMPWDGIERRKVAR